MRSEVTLVPQPPASTHPVPVSGIARDKGCMNSLKDSMPSYQRWGKPSCSDICCVLPGPGYLLD